MPSRHKSLGLKLSIRERKTGLGEGELLRMFRLESSLIVKLSLKAKYRMFDRVNLKVKRF